MEKWPHGFSTVRRAQDGLLPHGELNAQRQNMLCDGSKHVPAVRTKKRYARMRLVDLERHAIHPMPWDVATNTC